MSSLLLRRSVIADLRDRDLVRLYWPADLRLAFDALFAIDDALANIVARSSEPTLAAIKLAWWRDQLEKLDTEPPPAEPRLRAVAAELLPRGIAGKELANLEECWALLLHKDDQPTFMRGVASRGPSLFTLAARLLGVSMDEHLADAAQSFAASDLGRRGILDLVPLKLRRASVRVPRKARPLTALQVLARRDMIHGGPPFEPEGTPGRAWTLLRHRLTGRL
jgi:phytoene synthase